MCALLPLTGWRSKNILYIRSSPPFGLETDIRRRKTRVSNTLPNKLANDSSEGIFSVFLPFGCIPAGRIRVLGSLRCAKKSGMCARFCCNNLDERAVANVTEVQNEKHVVNWNSSLNLCSKLWHDTKLQTHWNCDQVFNI